MDTNQMSDQPHRYTIATSGTCKWMKENNIPITRENFLKEAFPDGIPDPWTVDYEAELPEELQDFSIFGEHMQHAAEHAANIGRDRDTEEED